ncbi:allantoinase [Kallotenue papyrolyticum]|uniref:allantoinase n=1 Tax=Kallotenue papyrolyticum TaxID=1325125 RepID=UPI00046EC462|nr:allantoinase [Kallotenue papyrolyticum]
MSRYDLIVRGATLVSGTAEYRADLAIADGLIAALEPELTGSAAEEIDARGLHLFPGLIDAHVHFNAPGRADWEGFATGTRALAAGGVTSYCDMPLNAHPPTIDAAAFDAKLAVARRDSLVDFALWGGIVPDNLERLDELAARGVIGFKAFMSNSGIDDFPCVDDLTLYEGMQRAARLGLPVAVHAENDTITARLARRAIAAGRTDTRAYLDSRPAIAEVEAIGRALLLAEASGCAVHIVHVSTGRGVALVAEARAHGVDASCETCPHYLAFTDEDMERLGAVLKCAPPLRTPSEQEALWAALHSGAIPIVASDHSPAPPELKRGADFFGIWGGISGCQFTLQVLLSEGYARRGLPLSRIAAVTAEAVARRFRLPGKGRLAVGADADLALVDLRAEVVPHAQDLFFRHRYSPYIGRTMRGRVVRTLVRGTTVFREGAIVAAPLGRLLRPTTA